jgi:hypothetical protein
MFLQEKGVLIRAHSGPCSVMHGLVEMKNLRKSASGRGGSRRVWENVEVVVRSRSPLALVESCSMAFECMADLTSCKFGYRKASMMDASVAVEELLSKTVESLPLRHLEVNKYCNV